LLSTGPVLTDGSWGVHLQSLGLQPGESPDVWNITHPDRVTKVALAYVEAGSHIILTNTFGASRIMLARHGYAEQAYAINRAGAQLSRAAAAGKARVFASIGPSGAMLMMDDVTEEELAAAFDEQAKALAEGGAEAIVIETMSDLTETKLAVSAARSTGLPVVACMTFDSGKNKDRTMMGVTPEQAAQELTAAGADVIGANCGQGIEGYVPICSRLHAATTLPIWIKPNAGLPQMENGITVYKTTPQEFAAYTSELLEAGASFIGGCCGSNPEFIRALARQIAKP
ncbi:MAG TPA: homocysteine S-methyltransferase family protein, partial [Anaerolineae bacterium]